MKIYREAIVRWENAALLLGIVMASFGLIVSSLLISFDESLRPQTTLRRENSGGDSSPVEERFNRVVAFTPAITEIVYALAQEHRLVGTSSFVTYPPETRALPRLGGIIDPNLELITALHPDLFLTQGDVSFLEGIRMKEPMRIEDLRIETLDEFYAAVMSIGALFGCREKACVIMLETRLALARVSLEAALEPKRRVFVCLGREPGAPQRLFTTGEASFISELVEVAGGRNIFCDLDSRYGEVSVEEVLVRSPEVIVDLSLPGGEAEMASEEWRTLFPDQTVRIVLIREDYAQYPGPRMTILAQSLLDRIHG